MYKRIYIYIILYMKQWLQIFSPFLTTEIPFYISSIVTAIRTTFSRNTKSGSENELINKK